MVNRPKVVLVLYYSFILLLLLFPLVFLETQQVQAGDVAPSLIWELESLAANVNWTESLNTMYIGYSLSKVTLSQLQKRIDASNYWKEVLYYYTVCKKFGLENQTKIQWALDNATIMANGLPQTAPFYNAFLVYHRYSLQGYYFAEKYNYALEKWNKTKAYENFKWAIDNIIYPCVLRVYHDNTTYMDTRFYDGAAETLDCFLAFYDLGIDDALNEATEVWTWINSNLWTGTHYKYNKMDIGWECEAGGFLQIISKFYYRKPDASNIERLITDTINRFLDSAWLAPQWSIGGSTYYACVHHNPHTAERRLENTIMSWAAILGAYYNFSDSNKTTVKNMMAGYSGYDPAWKLLFNDTTGLYNSSINMFKESSGSSATNSATSWACGLLLNLGIVPQTAVLAVPVEEYYYQYHYNMIDRDIYNINITARTLRIGLTENGTVKFLFGLPVTYNFPNKGLYDITFDANWATITNVQFIGDLPSNRKYLVPDPFPPTYSNCGTNTTKIGQSCLFYCMWTDNKGLSGFIFGTNNTGHWKNDTFVSLTETVAWSNITKTLNSTIGVVIQWQIWCNDTSNNWNSIGMQSFTTTSIVHDVAVVYALSSSNVISKEFDFNINVTVKNQGDYTETFNVTIYFNDTAVILLNGKSYAEVTLTSGKSTSIAFICNTTSFAYGNYTIKAIADTVIDETATEDNTYVDGWVVLTIPGDVNGDYTCEGKDNAYVAKAYDTRPGDARWIANADINGDGKVEGKDVAIVARYYDTHYP